MSPRTALLCLALLLVVHLASGCATSPERYLSAEQDERLRALCEAPGGCAVIPGAEWQQIRHFLKRFGIDLREEG